MTRDTIVILRALALLLAAAPLAAGCDDEPADADADADADGDADADADADQDGDADGDGDVEDVILPLTILQTSDVHHRASGFGPQADYTPLDTADADPVLGGYARLAALVSQIRAEQEAAGVPVLVVDSGDFMMGTIYDMTAQAPLAFAFLQAVGYDAVTLGNHEFDWSPAGLAMLIEHARAATPAFDVPIVASNTLFSPTDAADDALAAYADSGVIQDTMVVQLENGLQVGIIGLIGEEAEGDAPTAAPVVFEQSAMFVSGVVEDVRAAGAQMVLALSHQGLEGDLAEGEDIDLATTIDGIDVIASGHSHLPTETIIDVDGTLIMQPGEYGEFLSRLDLEYNVTQGRIESSSFTLIPVDDTVEGDADVQAMVEAAHAAIDPALEAGLGVASLDPIAELGFELEQGALVETGLGDLCADAIRTSATMAVAGSTDPTPFDAAVVPNGVLRDDLHAGEGGLVTFSDAYNLLPLGMSPDPANQTMPGWPLISAYLTAQELASVCEVPASVAPNLLHSNSVYLNLSGIRCEYDPAGTLAHTVTAVYLCTDTFSSECATALDLDDDVTLYRLVTDLYTFLLIGMVSAVLPLEPKHADGTPIDTTDSADFMPERIDVDPATAGVQELANWVAAVRFIMGLPSSGGDPDLADIPEALYGEGGAATGRLISVTP